MCLMPYLLKWLGASTTERTNAQRQLWLFPFRSTLSESLDEASHTFSEVFLYHVPTHFRSTIFCSARSIPVQGPLRIRKSGPPSCSGSVAKLESIDAHPETQVAAENPIEPDRRTKDAAVDGGQEPHGGGSRSC